MPIQMEEPEPEFLQALENHTVTQGRDVHFTCVVNHLSNYRVSYNNNVQCADYRTIYLVSI